MKKRWLAALLSCTMAVGLLAGCSSEPKNPGDSDTAAPAATQAAQTEAAKETEAEKPAGPSGEFHNYITADVDSFNAHIYTQSVSADIFTMATLQLYRQYPTADGKAFELLPELAAEEPQKMDEEGKLWNIKLRENAKWETGEPINVDDVIYSFQMCLDPLLVNNRASQLASDYITIVNATEYSLQGSEKKVAWEDVGIKRVDDYTLGLELTAPVTEADIKDHFNYAWTCVMHKPTYEAGMDAGRTTTNYGSSLETFKSCGAFILTEWVPGSKFVLKRNPDFVLADKIKLDSYTWQVVGDRNTALELYLNGELDVVSLSPDAIEQYIDDPSIKRSPATSIQTIVINHGNTENGGILGNLNFRKALFYAIDRQSIAKMTNGIPANYLVASKCLGLDGKTFREMPESQEYLEPDLGYDPAKAKEHYEAALKECGLDKLTLTLQYNETSANNKAASEFLHKALPDIFGDTFTLELMAAPSSVLKSYVQGWKNGDPNSFELQWRGWNTSTAAPWNGLKVYTSMYSNKNEPYFNEAYDKIWEEANYDIKAKMDPEYRMQLTRDMEKMVLDDVACVPAYEAPSYSLINPRVHMVCDEYIPGYGFGFKLCSVDKQ